MPVKKSKDLIIAGKKIPLGKTADIALPVSESYTGHSVSVFIRVIRAKKEGPTVFLTGSVHGDELTGMGVVREIMGDPPRLLKGSLICLPVANVFGFENHSRYLPDRRDLNRCFPGTGNGSLANRLAHAIDQSVLKKSDFGIDLHSAGTRRTNFPQIRADMKKPQLQKLALSFGCEIIINNQGHANSLRYVASANGCPTILYEAGETMKCEPGTIKIGLRGVYNVLKGLGMVSGEPLLPAYQTVVKKTSWVRAESGGLLYFHVRPGDVVKKGARIATCEKIFSEESQTVYAPFDGLVIGMTTLPAVKPGEPICHLAVPSIPIGEIRKKIKGKKTLHRRVQKQLATSFRGSKK